MTGIADTGRVIAFLNRRDTRHSWAVYLADQLDGDFYHSHQRGVIPVIMPPLGFHSLRRKSPHGPLARPTGMSSVEFMKIIHFALACFLASGMLSAAQDNPAIRNIVKGKEYLAENGKRKEVKTTATGLQYEVLKEGTGASPKATSTVEVHYKGTLIDGTEFDSSYKRGQTISFPLNRVIPGWTEGLQLMKEGGKGRLVIPSNLAYGAAGAPPVIGPNETLVFEIELVKVK
jgi:FKBP-type peptidyl-prolyl cis-trans isomerase FklB